MDAFPEELLNALSKNRDAVTRFAGLDDQEKEAIANNVRGAKSAKEIDHIVSRL